MSEPDPQFGDYELLLNEVTEGVVELQGTGVIDINSTVQLSEEIEALRSIVEEVGLASTSAESITVG